MPVHAYRVPGHHASQVGADGVEAVLLNLAVLVHDEVGCITLHGTGSVFRICCLRVLVIWMTELCTKCSQLDGKEFVLPKSQPGRVPSLFRAKTYGHICTAWRAVPTQPCRTARQELHTGASVTQKQSGKTLCRVMANLRMQSVIWHHAARQRTLKDIQD